MLIKRRFQIADYFYGCRQPEIDAFILEVTYCIALYLDTTY